MYATFGIDGRIYQKERRLENVVWDPEKTINPHLLILGTSGAGKTYTLRKVIRSLINTAKEKGEKPPRIHVFDVHGDMGMEGIESSLIFSDQTDYGLNPLVVDPDPHYGGVRKRVENLIRAINRSSHKLGHRQESLFRALLFHLYERKGFIADDPDTWYEGGQTPRGKEKTFPNLHELCTYIRMIKTQMGQYSDEEGAILLERINQQIDHVARRGKTLSEDGLSEKALERFEEEIDRLHINFRQRIQGLRDGEHPRELEKVLAMGAERRTLDSLDDTLSNYLASGIFKTRTPPFDDQKPVWRYQIKPLESQPDIQRLFVQFRLEELFRQSMAKGQDAQVKDVYVVDEAHLFMNDDSDNMINRTAKEGRKFGVAMLAASQSPKHFSEDFLSLVSAKVVLKIDESFWQYMNNKMRIPTQALRFIGFGRRMVTQIKSSESKDGSNDYRLVIVPEDGKKKT